jgi:hypothetical protein
MEQLPYVGVDVRNLERGVAEKAFSGDTVQALID